MKIDSLDYMAILTACRNTIELFLHCICIHAREPSLAKGGSPDFRTNPFVTPLIVSPRQGEKVPLYLVLSLIFRRLKTPYTPLFLRFKPSKAVSSRV